jgi:2-polyprenyl-3-methyl-5-hydroxy-6-metoxy-1,4-benzoquinol methylase
MREQELQQTFLSESGHYKGAAGSKYFDWQNKNGTISGRIEARKFKEYVKPTDTVLDFGWGAGHVLRNLNCARHAGVEINPAARSTAAEGGIQCHDSIAGVEDSSFDVIISNQALEHVEFPIAVLRALRSKLKPSGVLVLCVPIDDWKTQRTYNREDINHHLQTWTPQLLGNSLFEAGFQPDQFSIRLLTHAWFPGAARTYSKLPEFLFDVFCRMFAVVARRRQLLAVARKPSES